MAHFLDCPTEIKQKILSYLTPSQLAKMKSVSHELQGLVEDKLLWDLYLKPEILNAEEKKRSFSASFGCLEGITEEGMRLHPLYPVYRSLKDNLDPLFAPQCLCSEGLHDRDKALLILSIDYFRSILLRHTNNLYTIERMLCKYDNQVMHVGFKWLLQPEVAKVFVASRHHLSDFSVYLSDCNVYRRIWFDGAQKSLDIARSGLESKILCEMLEDYANLAPHEFIRDIKSVIDSRRDDKVTLYILEKFIMKDTVFSKISSVKLFQLVKHMSDAVGLTEHLNLSARKVVGKSVRNHFFNLFQASKTPDKQVLRDIIIQFSDLLKEKLATQENQTEISPALTMR